MKGRPTIRIAAALALLVMLAGIGVPCAHAGFVGETTVSQAGSVSPAPASAEACHCLCHASWIPVQLAACCGHVPASRITELAPAEPDGCCLSLPGEPPRLA